MAEVESEDHTVTAADLGMGGFALAKLRAAVTEQMAPLIDALHRIANETYTRDDESLTSDQPTMIWQLVARRTLDS